MESLPVSALVRLKGFKGLIPPLSSQEYAALRDSIRREGILTPVTVWTWKSLLVVIDGHNRVQIAEELGIGVPVALRRFSDRGEALEWMWRNQSARRNWSVFAKIASLLKAVEPSIRREALANQRAGAPLGSSAPKVRTDERLAKLAGASTSTIKKIRAIVNEPTHLEGGKETLERLQRGDISIAEAHRGWKRKRRLSLAAKSEPLKVKGAHSEAIRIIHGSIRDVAPQVENGSVSLILTDPPYGKEFLSVYSDLAEAAVAKLKDGGVLACMSGQQHLPEVLKRLSERLTYLWTVALLHERLTGPGGLNRPLGVRTRWKPIVLFTKGKRANSQQFFEDVITGSEKDKRWHPHGQSVKEALRLIGFLTDSEDLVWDPFCGGGTTGEAAVLTGRRVLLTDVDPLSMTVTIARMNNLTACRQTTLNQK